MLNHKIGHSLTNVIASSSLALGIALTADFTGNSVQAAQLSWSNGTDEIISQLTPVPDNGTNRPSGDFTVTFSPDEIALININTDQFVSPFDQSSPPPFLFDNVTPVVGIFDEIGPLGGVSGITQYELNNSLVFDFNNGVVVTYAEGSTFLGEYDFSNGNIDGVGFEISSPANGSNVTVNGQPYYLASDPLFVPEFQLQGISITFDEPAGGIGGEFSAGVVKSSSNIPEPGTVFGLLTVGGLGLLAKRKKQA